MIIIIFIHILPLLEGKVKTIKFKKPAEVTILVTRQTFDN